MKVRAATQEPEERDYHGRPYPSVPVQYRGDSGQARYAMDRYEPRECEAAIEQAISMARARLGNGDDPAQVEAWLREQVTQASEDEAARQRFGRRTRLTLSEDPAATRAACAASLARSVIHDWRQRRR